MVEMIERRPTVGWLEVHAENLMQDGPATTGVERLQGHYPLSVHGVGLSLGSAAGIDQAHLARLKAVVDRYPAGDGVGAPGLERRRWHLSQRPVAGAT
jgi:uncharacterized protein